jgi:hypothetical protein
MVSRLSCCHIARAADRKPNVPVAPESERVAMPDVPIEEPTEAESTAPERQKEKETPRERVAMEA